MKKMISILLAVMLVVSVAAVSASAFDEYNPSDSYTVTNGTPTCEEAIEACGGGDTQTVYFQLPADDPDHPEENWKNHFNSDDLGLDYCQVCAYWYGDKAVGVIWPSGAKQRWVGYKATLIDSRNRIYRATIPNDGYSAVVIWNNGVNGGMDKTAEIFTYGRQLCDMNTEGFEEGDEDTLPEGSPDPESCDGCITIIDKSFSVINGQTGFPNYGGHWYVYYGNGCYGMYSEDSDNFVSAEENCCNPEHHDAEGNHLEFAELGDANKDGACDVDDVLAIQRFCVKLSQLGKWIPTSADVDGDSIVSIVDATRIQRFLAKRCNLDGTTPYAASKDPYK